MIKSHYYSLLFLTLFTTPGVSQITVDNSLTIQQIIEDVLINNACAEVSNFSSSTGTNFNDVNGIAVFDANGTDFPFESGVILSSGNALDSPGPNDVNLPNSQGTQSWPGDIDLEENTNATETFNATSIQFDFVPIFGTINFNFLMASEEYNQNFECFFSDAFAFILTDQITGVSQNLAVIPGTSIPIQVTTIRPPVTPTNPDSSGCPGINEQYFDTYNFAPFNSEDSAINYNGQTVPITATGSVIVGNPYTIKLVVADATDTALDTTIFLEANSFNLGVDLGDDLTIENGNAPCVGSDGFEIGATPDDTGTISYQWSVLNISTMQFEDIASETTETLFITASGTYQITATFVNGCSTSDQITIEYAPQPFANAPQDYTICDTISNDGTTTIDFTNESLIAEILGSQDPNLFLVTFYNNETNAENGTNPLPQNGYENVSNPQIIYTRVTTKNTNCYAVTSFSITVQNAPITTLPETLRLCVDQNNQSIPEVEGAPSPPTINTGLSTTGNTFQWFLNGQLLSNETGPNLVATQAGEYTVTITNINTQCSNTYTTTVFSSSAPVNVSAKVISNAFSSNNIIEVTAEGSNSIIYSLDDGPFQDSPVFENVTGGNHTITVKDSTGCGTTVVSIFVISYQRLLTPNNDGYHDTWNLDGLTDLDPNAVITIFDRFGKFITRITPSSPGWDGTYNGRPLYSNDYWFRAEYIENETPKTFRGHITLKR